MDNYKEALMQKIQEIAQLIMEGMGDKDVQMEPELDSPDMEEKEEEKELQEEDRAPIVKDAKKPMEDDKPSHPGRGPISFKEKAKAYKR